MGIMAAGAGELPVRIKRMFDSSYRVPFPEKTSDNMGSRCFVLMAVDAKIGGLHPQKRRPF